MIASIEERATAFSHKTDEELYTKLATVLRARGWTVTPPERKPERITVQELSRRMGRSAQSVSRSLRRSRCPAYDCHLGESGRILWITPTEELERFLRMRVDESAEE